jgi:hypothetical protein
MNDRPPACPQIMTEGPAAHCAEQVRGTVLYCTYWTWRSSIPVPAAGGKCLAHYFCSVLFASDEHIDIIESCELVMICFCTS